MGFCWVHGSKGSVSGVKITKEVCYLSTLSLLLELVVDPSEVGYSEAEVPDDSPLRGFQRLGSCNGLLLGCLLSCAPGNSSQPLHTCIPILQAAQIGDAIVDDE